LFFDPVTNTIARADFSLFRFAVGTGKPPTIPADYIKQCPVILDHPDATVEDGIVLAESLLFSALYYKLGNLPFLDKDGRCEELTAWETRWKHLLSMSSPTNPASAMKYPIY
jgi:hypothetical protein